LWIEWFGTGAAAAILLSALIFTGATASLDRALYDAVLRSHTRTPRTDIVLVTMDGESLKAEGEWPWPRRRQAQLISRIARDQPRAIAWYFLFASNTNPVDDGAIHDAMMHAPIYLISAVRGVFGLKSPTFLASSAARGVGSDEAEPDDDGIVRKAYLFEGASGRLLPRLALQLARLAGRGPSSPTETHASDAPSAIVRSDVMLIPYVGHPNSFREISAETVLQGAARAGEFRNKFVLVGATAPTLLDNYPTPVSTAGGMPDVEVEANILDALLSGAVIAPAAPWVTCLISLGLLLLVLTALVRLAPSGNLWLFAATTGLPLIGAAAGVIFLRVWAPPASFIVAEAIIVPYWGWRRLNAASAYLADELRALEISVGGAVHAGPRPRPFAGGDLVLQQMTLLQEAKTRVSDLRRFVADVLANFPDPILVVDRGGQILTVNQAAAEFAGRMDLAVAPGAPVQPILARLSMLNRSPEPIWPPSGRSDETRPTSGLAPLTGMGPGGRAYEVRFTATRSAGDEPTGWIIHLVDVTPLVSAMRQREEALQLLSHDMRSPQAAILATLSHPEFRGAPSSLLQRIERHARRTLELADSFVRLARAESARYVFEAIDLAHVAQDAAEAVWPLAQSGEVTIDLELGDEEFVILADRGLLTRALINLLDNAVKFSPSGRRVVCRLRHAVIEGAPGVACEIIDQAGGLGESDLASLFQRFGPSRNAPRAAAGVGLGLAMVRTVVSRHSGDIVCDSVEGEGTAFTITLPIHDEAEAQADPSNAALDAVA
jgi:CHASE2 domain-containing sensor protein/signal transduction histidine kinase